MRTFMFAYQPCCGNTGGGSGGMYRLYRANQTYRLIDNIYFVFGDRVVYGMEDCGALATRPGGERAFPFRRLKKYAPQFLFSWKKRVDLEQKHKQYCKYLRTLNLKYHFSADDIYIFHDFQLAHAFTKLYAYPNCTMVFHAQGSLYNEWAASSGHHSEFIRNYYNREFSRTVKKLTYLGFPSKGAEESLVSSEPSLRQVVEDANRIYLYSGITCPSIDASELPQWIRELSQTAAYKFATVAALNTAKAVERIPAYLGVLKRKGYDFKWVLVGQGVQAAEVQLEIERNGIEENVIWIQDYIAHDDILKLFSVTDFYILFHRYSIFDLSTLEAMHYGNIPILTPIGGNKEVILDNNGLLVSDFGDTSGLERLLACEDLSDWKSKNQVIQDTYFSSKKFLQQYADLINLF